jgi:streptogramin lyase
MARAAPLVVFALAGSLCLSAFGQKASSWRVYREPDGLPENACVSVALIPQGGVWVRHQTMAVISKIDGYEVEQVNSPGIGNARVYQSPGGQLWTAASQG